jgi:gp9|nr:MAG TPA: PGDYG protein [Caudoviricetes sp.]
MTNKYRKKPVVIEAIQLNESGSNISEILNFVNKNKIRFDADKNRYYIVTLEGNMYIELGDWIIKGVNEEFYPCKPDIFEKTYTEIKNLKELDVKMLEIPDYRRKRLKKMSGDLVDYIIKAHPDLFEQDVDFLTQMLNMELKKQFEWFH